MCGSAAASDERRPVVGVRTEATGFSIEARGPRAQSDEEEPAAAAERKRGRS